MKEIKCFADLIGLELSSVDGGGVGDSEVMLTFKDGEKVNLFHRQDCCEHVSINDVDGDIQDLVGGIVVEFEEVSNYEGEEREHAESYTWTFYKIGTTKGFVNMRWLGESNGYYSESVSASAFTGDKKHNDWENGEGWIRIN